MFDWRVPFLRKVTECPLYSPNMGAAGSSALTLSSIGTYRSGSVFGNTSAGLPIDADSHHFVVEASPSIPLPWVALPAPDGAAGG